MSYVRSGSRIYTASDRAKHAERRAYKLSGSPEAIYKEADQRFTLSAKNINAQHETWLRQSTLGDIQDQIRWIQCDIANRRFEMFATLRFQHDGIMREGVCASGDYRDRQAWLYWSLSELKFISVCALRFGIMVTL